MCRELKLKLHCIKFILFSFCIDFFGIYYFFDFQMICEGSAEVHGDLLNLFFLAVPTNKKSNFNTCKLL